MANAETKLDVKRGFLLRDVYHDKIDPDTGDAIIEIIDIYDERKMRPTKPSGEKYRQPSTLRGWAYRLGLFARQRNLTTATLDDIIDDSEAMQAGRHPETQDNLSTATLRMYEATLRVFYRHFDFNVDPDDIPLHSKKDTPIDPEDILTKDEIHQARTAASDPQEELIFDLLIYTGMRRTALRNIRVKDVHVDKGATGTYRYNLKEGGLKNADKRQGDRPLLGAKGSVQKWLSKYHPDPHPDKYLITPKPTSVADGGDDPVDADTIYKAMMRIKERSGIDKPMNPHMMRHCFVTICKRDYGMDDDDIKWLIGHSKRSNVMSETYSYLSDSDYGKNAEEAWGFKEEEPQSSFTPPACLVCDEPIPSDTAKACPNCGTVYTMDAKAAQDQRQEGMMETAVDHVQSDSDKEHFNVLREYIQNNEEEALNALTELLNQQQQDQ